VQSLAILVSAVLALSCDLTDKITEADQIQRYTHRTHATSASNDKFAIKGVLEGCCTNIRTSHCIVPYNVIS